MKKRICIVTALLLTGGSLFGFFSDAVPVWLEIDGSFNGPDGSPEAATLSASFEDISAFVFIRDALPWDDDSDVTHISPWRHYVLSYSLSGSYGSGTVELKTIQGWEVVNGAVNVSTNGNYTRDVWVVPQESVGLGLPNTATSLNDHPSEIFWSFGLGSESTGSPVASILWAYDLDHTASSIPDAAFSLDNVIYDPRSSAEVDANYHDADLFNPYQIRTYSVLVEVTELTSPDVGFVVKYYHPGDYTTDAFDTTRSPTNTYTKNGSGSPYCTIEVKKTSSTTYQVYRQYETDSTPLVYKITRNSSPDNWKMEIGEGVASSGSYILNTSEVLSVHEETFSTVATDVFESLLKIKESGGTVVHESRRRIDETGAYLVITQIVAGETDYPTNKLQTDITFYTGIDTLTKWSEYQNGGWTSFNYNSKRLVTDQLSPFKDSPSTPTITTSGFMGRWTKIQYAASTSVGGYTVSNNTAKSWWRPAIVEERIENKLVSKSVNKYTFGTASAGIGGQSIIDVETTSFADASTSFVSKVISFSWDQDSGDEAYRNLPYWAEGADGQVVYNSYTRGTLNSTQASPSPSFTANSNGTGWKTESYTGTVYSTAYIDSATPVSFTDGTKLSASTLYLIPNVSRRVTTIRDGFKEIVKEEIFTGDTSFATLSWVFSEYSYKGDLLYSEDSRGNKFETSDVSNGEVQTTTDESGIVREYTYDALGRILTIQQDTPVSGEYLTVTHAYDAAGRTISVTKYSDYGEVDEEQLTSSVTYDKSGFKTSETSEAGKTISYERVLEGSDYRKIKTSINTSRYQYVLNHRDGLTDEITGPAVVDQYFTYTVATDGYITTESKGPEIGTGNVQRTSKQKVDWLGRVVETKSPSFDSNRLSENYLTTQFSYYDGSSDAHRKGKLEETRVISDASTSDVVNLKDYYLWGTVAREGLDEDLDGDLEVASMDRVTEYLSKVTNDGTDYWLESWVATYPTDNSSSNKVYTNYSKERLTGFTSNLRSESHNWSMVDSTSDPKTITKVEIDRSNKTVTTTIDPPTSSNDQVNVQKAGMLVSETAPSGRVKGYYYDGLGRLIEILDGSNTPATTTDDDFETRFVYYEDSPLLKEKKVPSVESSSDISVQNLVYDNDDPSLVTRQYITYNTRIRSGVLGGSSSSVTENKYSKYNDRGQLTHVWGNAVKPVMYEYNGYGQRTKMYTYSDSAEEGDWANSTWPENDFDDTSLQKETEWIYDDETGLLTEKDDDSGKGIHGIQYDWANRRTKIINERDQEIYTSYYPKTGGIYQKEYKFDRNLDDEDPTKTSSTEEEYSYNRIGQVYQVDDQMGTRSFAYQTSTSNIPLALAQETLPSAYGDNNVLVQNYDSNWLSDGYELGESGSVATFAVTYNATTGLIDYFNADYSTTSNELHPEYQSGIPAGFKVTNSTLGSGVYFYNTRAMRTDRPLIAEAKVYLSSTTFSEIDYAYTDNGSIRQMTKTGDLYSPYGSGTSAYADRVDADAYYNRQGELTGYGEWTYNSSNTNDFMFDRRRDYEYDQAGNRKYHANKYQSGEDYTSNSLDQYTEWNEMLQDFITGITDGNTSAQWIYHNNRDAWDWTRRPGGGEYFYIEHPLSWLRIDKPNENPPEYNVAHEYKDSSNNPTHPYEDYTDPSSDPIDFAQWFYASWISPNWNGYSYNGAPRNPAYDDDGNMIWDGPSSGGGIPLVYEYDAENRLTKVFNWQYIFEFTYDYMGRRAKQVIKDRTNNDAVLETKLYVYDGYHLIAQYDLDGETVTPERTYYWGFDISGTRGGAGGIGGLQLIYDHVADKRYIPGYDAQGNVIMIYGVEDDHVIAEYEYDPYGNLIRENGWDDSTGPWLRTGEDPIDNPFRWQTKWFLNAQVADDTFGTISLYDFGFRFYHPRLGRFVNRDPIGEKGGNNLYGYARNNPINNGDYLGFDVYNTAGAWDGLIAIYGSYDAAMDHIRAQIQNDGVKSKMSRRHMVTVQTVSHSKMVDKSCGSISPQGGSSFNSRLSGILIKVTATIVDKNGVTKSLTKTVSAKSALKLVNKYSQATTSLTVGTTKLISFGTDALSNMKQDASISYKNQQLYPGQVNMILDTSTRMAIIFNSGHPDSQGVKDWESAAIQTTGRVEDGFYKGERTFLGIGIELETQASLMGGKFDVVILENHNGSDPNNMFYWGSPDSTPIGFTDSRWGRIMNAIDPAGTLILHVCLLGSTSYPQDLASLWGRDVMASPEKLIYYPDAGHELSSMGNNEWYLFTPTPPKP